ncbi:unnamed protein product [Merluccius merluccius]
MNATACRCREVKGRGTASIEALTCSTSSRHSNRRMNLSPSHFTLPSPSTSPAVQWQAAVLRSNDNAVEEEVVFFPEIAPPY